jgi:prepilin-type processing-associated H-X9-DG protein
MNQALGNSTAIWLPSPPYRTYLRTDDLVDPPPSRLWVFLDEHSDSINDGAFGVAIPSSPSQARLIDYPAAWHNGGAGISFADGRAEVHRWVDSRTKPILRPGQQLAFNVASPNNADVLWLAQRTSSRAY